MSKHLCLSSPPGIASFLKITRFVMFSCLIFISTQHYRARRHKLDIWALPDYEHFRNASLLFSSLSLSNSLIRSHLLPLLLPLPLPLPPPPPLVVAPGLLHTRLHSLLILPPILLRTGLVEQIFNGLKTLKSCAAMELAGELGFGSLRRDWMLVRMADTS